MPSFLGRLFLAVVLVLTVACATRTERLLADEVVPPAPLRQGVCGDGILDVGEQCDPGATATTCCSALCVATANGTGCDDGNECTQTDSCQSGTCTGSNPVVCAAPDQCHNLGTCNPATGLCSNPAKVNGTSCNDGNACTQTDSCQAGTCTGSNPVVCPAADQCHQPRVCAPATGLCSNTPKPNDTACNDGNACTQTDTCQAGTCTGSNPVVCTPQDQCHETGTCNTLSGVCSNPARANGTSCTDGNACTKTDTCQGGVCTGANPVVCTAVNSCHTAGTCNPSTGGCTNPEKANGTACNDGNACTLTDTCQGGFCFGDNPKVCPAANQCQYGACNTVNGSCSSVALPNGTGCNDGNACTQVDSCQAGACTGSSPISCAATDACHDDGTCDTSTGACSSPRKPDGTACPSGICSSGACIGEPPDGGVIDSGIVDAASDGATDSSTGPPDAASADASRVDAARDAGAEIIVDAARPSGDATTIDNGVAVYDTGEEAGCACDTAGAKSSGAWLGLTGLVYLLIRRRRK